MQAKIHCEQRDWGKLQHGEKKSRHCNYKFTNWDNPIYQETQTLKLYLQWILIQRDL